jgi:hypothetical protein
MTNVVAQRVSKAIPGAFGPFDSTLYGVLVHGAEGFFGYAVDGACGKGSNATVECISRTLQKLAKQPERQRNWPKVLFLQVDGCIGDNKNRTLFAYAGWLVAQGNFKEVHVNFLLVGHTHEDIDAIFGVISKFFKVLHAAIITVTELMTTIFNALSQRTHKFNATHPMEHMRSTYDWSSFLIGSKENPNLREFAHYAKQVSLQCALPCLTVLCALYSALCFLCTVLCDLCCMSCLCFLCSLWSAIFALCSVLCTLYPVLCALCDFCALCSMHAQVSHTASRRHHHLPAGP